MEKKKEKNGIGAKGASPSTLFVRRCAKYPLRTAMGVWTIDILCGDDAVQVSPMHR